MIKTTANKNRFMTLFLLLVVAFGALVSFGTGAPVTTRAAESSNTDGVVNGTYIDFHGIKLDPSTEVESYGLFLGLTQTKHSFFLADVGYNSFKGLGDMFQRVTKEVSLFITFPNVKIVKDNNEYIFRLQCEAVLDLPMRFAFASVDVHFKNDILVSLTNAYYKQFLIWEDSGELDLSQAQVQVINGNYLLPIGYGEGFGGLKNIYNIDFPYSLEVFNVPASVLDPESPDFDIGFGDNGDSTGVPSDGSSVQLTPSLPDMIATAFRRVFSGGAVWYDWVFVSVISLLAVKFLFFIFKKR